MMRKYVAPELRISMFCDEAVTTNDVLGTDQGLLASATYGPGVLNGTSNTQASIKRNLNIQEALEFN